jgi:muconolactone delta-isomerase
MEAVIEFLVEFELRVPAAAPEDEVEDRENAEASAAARLAKEGHLVRLWKLPAARRPRP